MKRNLIHNWAHIYVHNAYGYAPQLIPVFVFIIPKDNKAYGKVQPCTSKSLHLPERIEGNENNRPPDKESNQGNLKHEKKSLINQSLFSGDIKENYSCSNLRI